MFFKNLQFLDKKWNFDTLCLSSLPSAYIHNTYRNSILVIHQSIFSKDESHTQVEKGTIFIIKSKGSKNNPRICKNEVGFEKFVFHTQLRFYNKVSDNLHFVFPNSSDQIANTRRFLAFCPVCSLPHSPLSHQSVVVALIKSIEERGESEGGSKQACHRVIISA